MKISISAVSLMVSAALLFITACSAATKIENMRDVTFRVPVTMIEGTGGQQFGPGDYGRNLIVNNQERYYEIHVPPAAMNKAGVPLVLVFHGGGSDQGIIRYESQMDVTANHAGFIAVYPAGTNTRLLMKDRILFWNDGRPNKDGTYSQVDDVQFVRQILDDMRQLFNINTRKVYACGYSNGAQFTYRLIKEIPDRIAAMAAVAGQRAANDLFPAPSRHISIMQFSGKLDTIGPYQGGAPHFEAELQTSLKPVLETVQSWADFNGCTGQPERMEKGNAVMERHSGCANGTEVILWTLLDGGHTWPGGNVIPAAVKFNLGPINRDIFASDLMWEFFNRHALP